MHRIRLEGQDKYPTVRDVVRAVNRGFQRGEEETGVKARSILACIRGMPGKPIMIMNHLSSFLEMYDRAPEVELTSSGRVFDDTGCSMQVYPT